MELIEHMVQMQKELFLSNKTLTYQFRIQQLKKLKEVVHFYESDILNALNIDLNKSEFEAYATELSIFYQELNYTIKHLCRWMKPQYKPTPLVHQPARSLIYNEPYGLVLIIAPWNYPFLLALQPLIGAIAAGNCVTIKPSEFAPHTSNVIEQIVLDCFKQSHVQVILGDDQVSKSLTTQSFDYIFFTGSTDVGRHVMSAASEHLTPVTLELGGKSPCIVDHTANIKLAAKRIVWGKFINAGQTCIAPDYILVEKHVKKELMYYIKEYIIAMYSENPIQNSQYPKIINNKHFERLMKMLKNAEVFHGGQGDESCLKVEPSVLDQVRWDDPVMQEEIFGPILPVVEYNSLKEVVQLLNNKPKPLACYIFSQNKRNINRLIHQLHFGGGAVNDTLIHIGNHHLPFGGVGASGMGSYHGKASFNTFLHQKSILKKANWIDLPLKYAPHRLPIKLLRYLMG